VPFGGTLDRVTRWVPFSSLMPWEDLEESYAPQCNPTTGRKHPNELPHFRWINNLMGNLQTRLSGTFHG